MAGNTGVEQPFEGPDIQAGSPGLPDLIITFDLSAVLMSIKARHDADTAGLDAGKPKLDVIDIIGDKKPLFELQKSPPMERELYEDYVGIEGEGLDGGLFSFDKVVQFLSIPTARDISAEIAARELRALQTEDTAAEPQTPGTEQVDGSPKSLIAQVEAEKQAKLAGMSDEELESQLRSALIVEAFAGRINPYGGKSGRYAGRLTHYEPYDLDSRVRDWQAETDGLQDLDGPDPGNNY